MLLSMPLQFVSMSIWSTYWSTKIPTTITQTVSDIKSPTVGLLYEYIKFTEYGIFSDNITY